MIDKKVALCFAVCFTISFVFFQQSLDSIATMLTLNYILGQNHAAPWAVLVNAACAGPATMGLFIALFALMMLDRPLPARKAGCIFAFGIVGTWVQSLVRLIILLLVGYYYGEAALWTAHFWTIYVLFPLWYLIFLYVYFYVYNKNEIRRTQG